MAETSLIHGLLSSSERDSGPAMSMPTTPFAPLSEPRLRHLMAASMMSQFDSSERSLPRERMMPVATP
jgi:hypothetical protein